MNNDNNAVQATEAGDGQYADHLLTLNLSPAVAKARMALTSGKVQPGMIAKHKGKGGKVFDYIKHVDATKTMIDAFGQLWGWEVMSHEVFSDGSAVAYGKMTLTFYGADGYVAHTRVIQEVGAKEPITNADGKIVSPVAFTVLGAASRSLLRCMMRAFGYGLELYREDDQEFTAQAALKVLEDYAKQQGLRDQRDRWVNALKAAGIGLDTMVDRFEEAYKMVYEVAKLFKEERREQAKAEEVKKKLAKQKPAETTPQ